MANGRGASGWNSTTRSKKLHLPLDDVEEQLAGRRCRPEADKVDRMTRIEGVADLALRLEATNSRPLTSSRVHHHDRPFPSIYCDTGRRDNARQRVVDRPGQRATVHQHLVPEAQHSCHRAGCDLDLFVTALAQQIEEKNAALERVHHVFRPSCRNAAGASPKRSWESGRFHANQTWRRIRFRRRLVCGLHGLIPSRSICRDAAPNYRLNIDRTDGWCVDTDQLARVG